jgi:hypothetical protein
VLQTGANSRRSQHSRGLLPLETARNVRKRAILRENSRFSPYFSGGTPAGAAGFLIYLVYLRQKKEGPTNSNQIKL